MTTHPLFRFFFLSIVLTAAVIAQDTFTLEYKFIKGETYRYRTVTNNAMTNDVGGKKTTTNNNTVTTTKFIVEQTTPERSFVLVSSMDSLLMNGVKPSTAMFDPVGKRMRVWVTSRGAIERREIIDTMKNSPMGKMTQREYIAFHQLPEKQQSKGSAWTAAKSDTGNYFGTTMITISTTNYNVAGTEQKNGHACVKITYITSTATSGSGEVQGYTTSAKGNSTGEGTMYFDTGKGILIADEDHSKTTMSMSMSTGSSFSIETIADKTQILVE